MKLEQFLLSELKDMFIYVKVKYSILCNYKIYQQNKNDVIIIMRNSGNFNETHDKHIIFEYDNHKIKFEPESLKKKYYRGEKHPQGMLYHTKKVVLNFN